MTEMFGLRTPVPAGRAPAWADSDAAASPPGAAAGAGAGAGSAGLSASSALRMAASSVTGGGGGGLTSVWAHARLGATAAARATATIARVMGPHATRGGRVAQRGWPRLNPGANSGNERSVGAWLWSRRYHVIYLVLAAWFVRKTLASYDRHTGFTVMETFGEKFADRRLAQLREVPIHTRPDSYGYDGQWYAQVAVAGNPLAPELRGALDSPAYRARRSLMPVLAHLAGLGRPVWVLNAYALSGLVCWLLLALAL